MARIWNKHKQSNTPFKTKILVTMSGGVDSSLAAALLVKQGYDVTGAFMVNYDENIDNASCWRSDYQDALRVAAKLGIQLLRLDFTKEYKKMVLDYMYRGYKAGRTPNPDILCNKYIKFGAWLDKAKKMGFDYLATGHYAKIKKNKNRLILIQAKDKNKDQTYFLHQLNQEQLENTLFPIGGYLKSEVRQLANEFNLPTANKEESMGICFVGEVKMKDFLQKKIKVKKGDIITSDGQIIGKHDGLAFYTIGQRIGFFCHSERSDRAKRQSEVEESLNLKRSFAVAKDDKNKSLFVVNKNIKKNQLIISHENDPLLYQKEAVIKDINWIAGREPDFPLKCNVRLRHRQPLQVCVVEDVADRDLLVKFNKLQRAITPGQFAVFYKNQECLGGGVIR
jgi:tRNA-specific 2-thiouridylase